MSTIKANYSVGQIVQHALFSYRGVIIDVDPAFQGTEEWYEQMAPSKPSRNQPWYHLLVHGSVHHAYAPESQLVPDHSGEPIEHPELDHFFDTFHNGCYTTHHSRN